MDFDEGMSLDMAEGKYAKERLYLAMLDRARAYSILTTLPGGGWRCWIKQLSSTAFVMRLPRVSIWRTILSVR